MDNKEQSLDRIKLLMNYSVEGTLTENIRHLQGNLLKEDPMTGVWYTGDNYEGKPDQFAERRQIISIPGFNNQKINVVEGTTNNLFTSQDDSGTLFAHRGLKKDKYGWYEVRNNTKVYYPEKSFWDTVVGSTKNFKTGPTVSNPNGDSYHFILNLDDNGWSYATIGYKQSINKSSRGWKITPWYYKTNGDEQIPYDESTIDTRDSFDKFWDENGVAIQLVGGLIIGAVTMGIGNLITAAIIAEAGIAAAETALIASEVATVVNAVNTGRRWAFALDALTEVAINVPIGIYEEGREKGSGTMSFVFAALPFIKVLPGFSRFFNSSINFTQKNIDEIVTKLETFTNDPAIFKTMTPKSQQLFEEVVTKVNKNPEAFGTLVNSALAVQATKTVNNKVFSNKIINSTVKLGRTTYTTLKHIGKTLSKDLVVVKAFELMTDKVRESWDKLLESYENKNGKEMPDEEIKRINSEVQKLPTEEEQIKYIEDLAQSIDRGSKVTSNSTIITSASSEIRDKIKNNGANTILLKYKNVDWSKTSDTTQQSKDTIPNNNNKNPFDDNQ